MAMLPFHDEPFHEERLKINRSWCKISENFPRSILYINGRTVALVLFLVATDAVRLASDVMVCAALRRGSEDHISLYTIKQTLSTYVSIMVTIVDDLSNSPNKINRKTFLSLLGSLGGIAAIVRPTLENAMRQTISFVMLVFVDREKALDQVKGRSRVLDDVTTTDSS
uniref:Uncharacterized protein n=1 Tax=Leersia perrieri TaxID=77586 RepID=A0A0D9WA78_9ORYZ